uniref:Cka2 n=1 Tax=Arundo donax TaxID=35708 RepID=A0A0A9E8H2_ARUDO
MLISDNIKQLHDIRSSTQILKYFDLSFDLLFLHRLKDLNNAFLIIVNIDSLKDFTVFPSPNFPDNFIIILLTPLDGEGLVVPVVLGAQDVNVGVDPSLGHGADLDPAAIDRWTDRGRRLREGEHAAGALERDQRREERRTGHWSGGHRRRPARRR